MTHPHRHLEPSLHKGGYHTLSAGIEQPYMQQTGGDNHFDNTINLHQGPRTLHNHHDPYGQQCRPANELDQYNSQHWDFNVETHGPNSSQLAKPSFRSGLHFPTSSDQSSVRTPGNYVPQSRSSTQHQGLGTGSFLPPRVDSHSADAPQMSTSAVSVNQHLMQPSRSAPERNIPLYNQVPSRQTKYEPFRDLFPSSEDAKSHRHQGTRFDRMPYHDPGSDATIFNIENDRQRHVMRIYNAMTSGEQAKDNRGSIAMKRWVIEAHYPPDLVEAYAHKVFDCLLGQAKEGFRGWVHNDYVADERKGEDIDKEVDCAGRLDNMILALEQEKTICEDVMNSACQIRMFVNAPRAYANRKHQNRVGNSKRGRTKDSQDPNPKPSKISRTCGKRSRTLSNTISDGPTSRDTTPQYLPTTQHTPPSLPYFPRPPSQFVTSSPVMSNYPASGCKTFANTNTFATPSPLGLRPIMSTSPPAPSSLMSHASQPYPPRLNTAPSYQQSILVSPPPLFHEHFSAPTSPDDLKPVGMNHTLGNWSSSEDPHDSPQPHQKQERPPIDPMLFTDFTDLNAFDQPHNGFTALCDIEGLNSPHIDHSTDYQTFEELWGVQHDPHDPPSTGGPFENHKSP